MRCKHCDHVLWNQPAPAPGAQRVCSECGEPYQPGDFRFARGKVRFCCPQCDTGYYGTSAEGHLEPAAFDCVGCGRHLTMNDCVVRAHDMEHESEAMLQRDMPWLDESIGSGARGWLKRWGATTSLSFSNAGKFVALLHRPPQPMRAAAFMSVNALISVFATVAVGLILPALGNLRGRVGGGGVDVEALVIALAIALGAAVALVVFAALPAVLVGLIPRGGKPVGTARAFEAMCYSSGALVLSLVPCCGGPFAAIWWMVQSTQAMMALFEGESIGKKTLAALLTVVGYFAAVFGTTMVIMRL